MYGYKTHSIIHTIMNECVYIARVYVCECVCVGESVCECIQLAGEPTMWCFV